MEESESELAPIITTPGLELTMQGLNHDTPGAACLHFLQLLSGLEHQGESFSPFNIVSPSTTLALDYIHVSLSGELRGQAQSDLLEDVQVVFD